MEKFITVDGFNNRLNISRMWDGKVFVWVSWDGTDKWRDGGSYHLKVHNGSKGKYIIVPIGWHRVRVYID